MAKKRAAIINDIAETSEIMASAIKEVAAAARKLLASRLTQRTVCLLIRDACGNRLGLKEIEEILDIAGELDVRYLKKPPAEKGRLK